MNKYTIIGLILTFIGTIIITINGAIEKNKLKIAILVATMLGIGMVLTYIGSIKDNNENTSVVTNKLNKIELEMQRIITEDSTSDKEQLFKLYSNFNDLTKEFYEKQDSVYLKKIKPKINIRISENSNDQLRIEIKSDNELSEKVDKLFLKFHLPGIYDSVSNVYKDKVGELIISSSWRRRINDKTTSQTVSLTVENLFPTGTLSFSLNYKPTQKIKEKHGYFEFESTPLMDLYDILKYYIFWRYKSVPQMDFDYLDISDLSFIRKDNEQLLTSVDRIKAPVKEYVEDSNVLSEYISSQLTKGNKNFTFKLNNPLAIEETVTIKNDTIYWIIKRKTVRYLKSMDDIRKMELARKNW